MVQVWPSARQILVNLWSSSHLTGIPPNPPALGQNNVCVRKGPWAQMHPPSPSEASKIFLLSLDQGIKILRGYMIPKCRTSLIIHGAFMDVLSATFTFTRQSCLKICQICGGRRGWTSHFPTCNVLSWQAFVNAKGWWTLYPPVKCSFTQGVDEDE